MDGIDNGILLTGGTGPVNLVVIYTEDYVYISRKNDI